ncbi:MAG: L,D-transpeptidase family protein [Gammaproteobacteria bacterium]|nr:L,D-transpeptidase family protein [Gammaproteobacteria bacterium]
MKKHSRLARSAGLLGILFFTKCAFAATYALPSTGDALIGKSEYVTTTSGETLVSIAKRFDVGLNGIVDANGGINPSQPLPHGITIHVPTKFLLPAQKQKGIVINLPEMRMYYYPPNSHGIVMTYPIGIGKVNKTIPIANTSVSGKTLNPSWTPPKDIREFNEQQGITLPVTMPAGPDNPLGPYAIYLNIPTFLIHSTIFPESVGKRASFGCIRMHETDIKDFYPLVSRGTPVSIINVPTKTGWKGNHLFLETHDVLQEHPDEGYNGMVNALYNSGRGRATLVDWQLVAFLAEDHDGMPHDVGFKVN